MSRYSWFQKKLHSLALSSQTMRESTFDLETSIFSNSISYEDHIFIAGLARSGTTAILNALYQSGEFASLSYQDMPFVLAPNFWSIFSSKKTLNPMDREHGDGIKISIESPEAFEEIFWKTFDDKDVNSKQKFKTFVSNITKKNKKLRYLSKNNQNIRRISLIRNIFPNSKILITYRDPLQQSYSLLTQHQLFIQKGHNDKFLSNYMKWIGHTEFGAHYSPIINEKLTYTDPLEINHWLEQWSKIYSKFLNQKSVNQFYINYEKLCSDKNLWLALQDILDLNCKFDYQFIKNFKDFSPNYDHLLLDKCNRIYEDLSNKSII